MAARKLTILGSTGSIGSSALKLVSRFPDRFEIVALAAGDQVETLAEQVRTFRPKVVTTRTEEGLKKLRDALGPCQGIEFSFGEEGAQSAASLSEVDVVLSAMVGAAGLRPTLAAVRAGKTVALANKESLVVAGALIRREVEKKRSLLLPVDSEHSAIFQALGNSDRSSVRRLVLTASGGPFFRDPSRDLSRVTRAEALAHPNWKMGEKITIDSATMMNKGLEIIEAYWLFGFEADRIDVVVHPQSIIHSMIEFVDGSVLAQLGVPDMTGPISYALAYPDRLESAMASLDFGKMKELNFFDPDHGRFPALSLARQALQSGETYPAVLNGANEVTVEAFLRGRIGFLDIPRINQDVLSSYRQESASELEDYVNADQWGRKKASERIGS